MAVTISTKVGYYGRQGGNAREAVSEVHALWAGLPRDQRGDEVKGFDPSAGYSAKTDAVIFNFQKRQGLTADATVDRIGRTIDALNRLSSYKGKGAAPAPAPAPAPGGAVGPGGAKRFKLSNDHKMVQGDNRWGRQQLNNSKDDVTKSIWHKGCLLSSIACAFRWKGVRLPEAVAKEVEKLLAKDAKHSAYKGPFNVLNPATLDAWMTLNGSQGFTNTESIELNSGKLSTVVGRRDLTFWGMHSDAPPKPYLALPTQNQMEKWINDEWVLIVRKKSNQHHFLWVTGHDGKGSFDIWDVGYGTNVEAGATLNVTVDELDRVYRWGPV